MVSNIIQRVKSEFENPAWAIIEQFLKIHEIVYVDGIPKIDRVDTDKTDGTTIAYISVKNEKFYMALYFDALQTLYSVSVESCNEVYFIANSQKFDLEELSSMTALKHTEGANKGDRQQFGNSSYKDSWIAFEPDPEPDEFEDKLEKLLDFLELDKGGITKLIENANGHIQASMTFHNGNTILTGPKINKVSLKRMSDLGLAIDFDLYAEGKKWP